MQMGNYGKCLKAFPLNSCQAYVPFLSLLQLFDVFRGYIKNRRLALNISKYFLMKNVLFISR